MPSPHALFAIALAAAVSCQSARGQAELKAQARQFVERLEACEYDQAGHVAEVVVDDIATWIDAAVSGRPD